jgi:Raf kinase inhibitor-like YbhB/YbcL family protein
MGFVLSPIQLRSNSFTAGGAIPKRHTGEGEDVSPHLAWSNAPAEAKSFAVICHDPDAPLISKGTYGFVHWVLYNLPASTKELEEGTKAGTTGKNDFGKQAYGGPMPPEGHGDHRYYFWILALNAELNLPPGLTLWQLLEKIEPNVIAGNRLVGTYRR